MKRIITVLFLITILSIISCEKSGNDPSGTEKAKWGTAIWGTDKWNL